MSYVSKGEHKEDKGDDEDGCEESEGNPIEEKRKVNRETSDGKDF
jgi:hypothetical protein